MKEDEVDPDGIRVFIPESKEMEERRKRQEIYETHLKKVRKMISRGLVVFVFICWLFSQNGRYQPSPSKDGNAFILDTRTGATFDWGGYWLGNESNAEPVKIYRLEMGFWPYFGFWKVKTQH